MFWVFYGRRPNKDSNSIKLTPKTCINLTLPLICLGIIVILLCGCQESKTAVMTEKQQTTIIYPDGGSDLELLAAKEIRRYIYLRTNTLLEIKHAQKIPEKGNLIIVATQNSPILKAIEDNVHNRDLSMQEYRLKTISNENRYILTITGGSEIGTLYGAYRFAEEQGIGFYLHGDTIPDKKIAWEIPQIDINGSPLFELRGIQPFHDFPEGPDWWNADDYKAIFAQLPKLGMNFFALHTYPEGGVGPEPTVWIGPKEDINEDGTVTSGYPSRHMTTKTNQWNYSPKSTSDYIFGASEIYETDDYGADYMTGVNPWKEAAPEVQIKLFNDFGKTLDDVFSFAKSIGIKTCIGTELPLTIPAAQKKRLKNSGKDTDDPKLALEIYEGMFERIMKTHPLDYYWFWTHEGWTWSGVDDEDIERTENDVLMAVEAAKNVNAPFTLATCGWVLGPAKDRGQFDRNLPKEMPMSCINRNVGFLPVEKQFAQIKGRPKWAIPWMEDDPAMIIPQLWAGRMRRDAADSLMFGCTGLMGIHWRTRILGPNVSALAKAGWNQNWNPDKDKPIEPEKFIPSEYYVGGAQAIYEVDIEGTADDPLYQAIRYGLDLYHISAPSGNYTVTLRFSEPHYEEKGKRVFGVKIQGKKVLEHLDLFGKVGKNTAIDFSFENVVVDNDFMDIEFMREVEYPSINAIVIEGTTSDAKSYVRKINCAGPAYKDYESDLNSIEHDPRNRDLPCDDFYAQWALKQFGDEAAKSTAEIFIKLDGVYSTGFDALANIEKNTKLPRPSTWYQGPGGLVPDKRDWKETKKDYEFVEEMAALRPQVKGVGNLERFDYWLNNFRYMKATGKLNCTLYKLNEAIKQIEKEEGTEAKKEIALKTALPLRVELISNLKEVYHYLLSTVSTNGAMGNVTNWEQHVSPKYFEESEKKLTELLGEEAMQKVMPDNYYDGPARLIVPTARTSLVKGEQLKLKIIALGIDPIDSAVYYRVLGKGSFSKVALEHVNRSVYSVTLPTNAVIDDFEYYIEVNAENDQIVRFPVTAPGINQTVVIQPM